MKQAKVKLSAVSYLNTLPFIYGMESDSGFMEMVELSKDIPSECARKLIENEVDMGLIPIAAIPAIQNPQIIGNACIGAIGQVKTVLLLSDVPIPEIENVYLDYQSKTSVALCKILFKEWWKRSPNFLPSNPGFESEIKGKNAGVIIGDRTFNLPKDFAYQYDLSEEWQKHTGLPFVFAAWVANKPLDPAFITLFNAAIKNGLNHVSEAITRYSTGEISAERLRNYLEKDISYTLDESKLKALHLFLEKLETI